MAYVVDTFVLEHCFNKKITEAGEVVYWRSCVVQNGMTSDSVGYIVLYADGNHLHTYRNPENFL